MGLIWLRSLTMRYYFSNDWQSATIINGDTIANVADLYGADATGDLLTAVLDNQAVDSTVAVDDLVYA